MTVSETQRLTWQRDVLGEAKRMLVKLRSDADHGKAIEINNIIAQVDYAVLISEEIINKNEHTRTN